MILMAFDVKFDEKRDEIPPGACRPSKKLKKNKVEKVDPEEVKRNNVDKEGPPPVRPPERGVRGAQPPGYIYIYI